MPHLSVLFFIVGNGVFLSELKAEVSSWLTFWIPDRSGEAVKQLDKIFIRVQNQHRVPSWDLPQLDKMKQALSAYNISSIKDLNNKILKPVLLYGGT